MISHTNPEETPNLNPSIVILDYTSETESRFMEIPAV